MTPEKMLAELITDIKELVRNSPENNHPDGGRFFDEPLIAVAAGDNPLFCHYREAVGPFHWLPAEVLERAGFDPSGHPVSVLSWVLPIQSGIRVSNRSEKLFPSRQWALTRNYGEMFNSVLRRHVVEWFTSRGIKAAAPHLIEGWRQVNDGPHGIASTWSERHAAYAAGLGTFSLNDGFITERGMAHRLGSVVVATPLPVATAAEKGIFDNCLYHRFGRCGVCISRCPVKALSSTGHDKQLCMEHVYGTVKREVGELYGVQQTGCGLCQTAVPCEAINPCR